jgi:hypothetical protein
LVSNLDTVSSALFKHEQQGHWQFCRTFNCSENLNFVFYRRNYE